MAYSHSEPAPEFSAPSPFVLLCFGLTAGAFGLFQTGFAALDPAVLATALFSGGTALVLLGVADWRQHNPFGAVIGIAYGLFWLSLLGLVLLPATGFGAAPGRAAMGSYLGMWGLFSAILFAAGGQAGRRLQTVLGLLLACLLLLAVSESFVLAPLRAAAGWAGLAAGILALQGGVRQLRRDGLRRSVLPPRPADLS